MSPDPEPSSVGSDRAHLAALAGLPGMGPARLTRLLRERSAAAAWASIRAGDPPPDLGAGGAQAWAAWVPAARATDPARVAQAHLAAGVALVQRGDAAYPPALERLVDPPPVLFHRGDPERLTGPCVAVVGTRRCTRYGHDVARELGQGLALAGVRVVSGLATGVDAAAHHGALAGGGVPVGVVGTGLDVVYPQRNRVLWERVAAEGYLCGESPLGTPPARWRFPSRNRLIAALAHVVVVVESHRSGGALLTADIAEAVGRTVLAVPGSVRSPASEGTNGLLAQGVGPCTGVADVLAALGLGRAGSPSPAPERRTTPEGTARRVLAALGWEPTTFDRLVDQLGLPVGTVAASVAALEDGGWVLRSGNRVERIGAAP